MSATMSAMPLRAALRPAAVPQRTARAPLTLAPRPRPTPCGLAPHRFSLVPVRAAAEAEVADTGAKKATTDGEVAEGSISLAFKRVLVVVAQFLIGLLPGRMGLTWLAGLLPSSVKSVFMDLVDMYTDQMEKAVGDRRKAEEVTYGVFRLMCKAYAEQLFLPYNFPSYHRAIRSPTDYYKMGQQYIGCMIDFSRSILMYPDRWAKIKADLDKGENVILLTNHQSEGDAAFIPLLTEISHPGLGEQVTYIAGDRVVSDKLCKPFSMGRNLLCVNSKKYIMNDPSTRAEKMRANVRTLKEMERLLKKGGMLIWIAPSGGRDRRSPDGTLLPAKFDPAAVEMMAKLGTKKGVKPTHLLPMAMSTYDIMPPPETTQKDLGEERIVNFTGAGLSVGEEIDVSQDGPWAQGVDLSDKAACSAALAEYVYSQVCDLYAPIVSCNVPGGPVEPLPENAIRPQKPDIIPY